MTLRILISIFLCVLFYSCKQKREGDSVLIADTTLDTPKELPITLYLSDFGLYISNWPKHWVLANHGKGCKPLGNSAGFIFGSISTTEGSFQIETSDDLEEDYFSTFDVVKRDIWQDKKRVDLFLETMDGGKVKAEFFNLNRTYEKWALENVSFLPPIEETEIMEVHFSKFPIFAPKKEQDINILFGFDVLSSNRDYKISFQNRTSHLGVSCTLGENLQGSVVTSLGKTIKMLSVGGRISINAEKEGVHWELIREQNSFIITETKGEKTITLYEIPVSNDYDFTFYASED